VHERVVRCATPVLLALALAAPLAAQSGTLQGTVSDSLGTTLPNAAVTIEGTGLRATTGANGGYEVRGVPVGTFTVRARLIGFQATTARVTIEPGAAAQQNFTLGRSTVQLAPIDVVVGSRARHTAAEELAVPVDIFPAEQLAQQGSTETSVILQAVSPSINFPRQSVTDAGDVVRPFTLRGLSPDHTLVLVNGWRQHQTALVNNFTYGMGAGSSGVDLNAIPSSALDRIEVLRDGAAAQYGSDAIAGVVNLVLKDGAFTPFVNGDVGRYVSPDYPDDGTTVNVNGGWGIGLGAGSLGLFGEFRDRQPTNRAWADPFETAGTGIPDEINDKGQVLHKNNPVEQPNHHWGDGLQRDGLAFANFRMPVGGGGTEIYSFGGYSHRNGVGNPYRRYAGSARNWDDIYPLGFLPDIQGLVTDYSAAGGVRGLVKGWSYELGTEFGHNDFDYNINGTLNASLGPCLDVACAPGADGILGSADDPGIANQQDFFAGRVLREEWITALNIVKPVELGLPAPVNLAFGTAFRRERYAIREGELASYVNGGATDQTGAAPAPPGSQSFPGFAPTDATDRHRNNFSLYADAETNLSEKWLTEVAARFEDYSDFGSQVSFKGSVRYQPSPRVTLRAAGSTGFRAPGLSQVSFSKVVTNVISGDFVDVGVFPFDNPAAQALGAKPLKEETAYNLSTGVVLTPVNNFTITADYFHIRINDQILLGATFDDPATLGILAGVPGFESIDGVQYFTNGLNTRTQGVDVTAGYRVPAGRSGTLDLSAGFNWTQNEIVDVDPLPQVLIDAGSTEPGLLDSVTAIGIEDERPDWRGTLQANLTLGRFSSLGRFSYFGAFSSAQPGFCDLCRENYGGKGLADAEVAYQFNLIKLAAGVRNLFDVYPDQPSSTVVVDDAGDTAKDFNDNFGTFPWAAASPFGYNGRFVYARTEIQLAR
jgi:iron complex outermembrane recepter protein